MRRWIILLVAVGCAHAPSVPHVDASALQQWEAAPRVQRPRNVRISRDEQVPDVRRAPLRRASSFRGARIDISFHRAPLSEALRMLADHAGVNLVMGDDVSGEVSMHLSRVRPLDAMEALAQAHGARVQWIGRVALISASEQRAEH